MNDEYFKKTTSKGINIMYGTDTYETKVSYPSTPTESYRFEILDFDQETGPARSKNFFKKMKWARE